MLGAPRNAALEHNRHNATVGFSHSSYFLFRWTLLLSASSIPLAPLDRAQASAASDWVTARSLSRCSTMQVLRLINQAASAVPEL